MLCCLDFLPRAQWTLIKKRSLPLLGGCCLHLGFCHQQWLLEGNVWGGPLSDQKTLPNQCFWIRTLYKKKHALFSCFSPQGPMDADHPDRCKTCQGTCGTWCMCNTPGLWNLSLGHPQNLETMNFIWASHTLTCWWPEKCWRKLR